MELEFTGKDHLAGNAWAFHFAPVRPLKWKAGQFIRVEVPHANPDEEGTKRQFTIAAAPHEGRITIATRVTQSTFKRALDTLKPGDTIRLLDLPAGDFVWHDSPRPLVFVAQGIGITPFRSMLADRAHRGLPLSAELYYANITSGIPFEDELKAHKDLKLTLLDTAITVPVLAELVPDLGQRLVYIAGPKALITLLGPPYNVPSKQIRHDQFPNYARAQY
ncbi:MAG: flavodoxin reductase (ferredoxin-NADPH reductase) family 1 [Candidatus Saccharibacteria bacterium]|jgi:ferredoxin-NADP reductase|nr:flavodoxin reductase (ferredoxin-NADPH reductase) family 1 [Candidatus Saccharibacteria bacterium]